MNEQYIRIGKYLLNRRMDTIGNDLQGMDIGNVTAIESGDWDMISVATFDEYCDKIKISLEFEEASLE